jgi:hypothetical protein
LAADCPFPHAKEKYQCAWLMRPDFYLFFFPRPFPAEDGTGAFRVFQQFDGLALIASGLGFFFPLNHLVTNTVSLEEN